MERLTDHSEFWRERYISRLGQIADLQAKLLEKSNTFEEQQPCESQSAENHFQKYTKFFIDQTEKEIPGDLLELQIRIKAMNIAEFMSSEVITDLGNSAIIIYSRVARRYDSRLDPQLAQIFIDSMEHLSRVIIHQGSQQESLVMIKGLHFLFYSIMVDHPGSHFSKICTIMQDLCKTLTVPALFELAQYICVEAIKEISVSSGNSHRYPRLLSTTCLSMSVLSSANEASVLWGDTRRGFLSYYGKSLRKIRFKLQKAVIKSNSTELMDAVFNIHWNLLD